MSHATSIGFLPCFFKYLASFPHIVVLPAPCKPHIKIIVGGFGAMVNLEFVLPIKAVSSSLTILITCCPGVKLFKTLSPLHFSLILLTKSLTTK